jgi:universal stress protein E
MHFKKILVAIEFPAAKQQAGLARALQLARKSGAVLELFHAAYDPEIGDITAPDSDARVRYVLDIRRRQLEALRRDSHLDEAECTINVRWSHSVVDALSQEVLVQHCDLVVAESTRRGRFARFVLTNTDWELVRHLPAPLLLVKSAKALRDGPILCAVDPTHARGKSPELDAAVLRAGRRFANALGARVTAYHVYAPPTAAPLLLRTGVTMPLPLRVTKADQLERRRQETEALTQLARAQGLEKARIVVEEGDVRQLLVERAAADRAQIVVLGAVARGVLDRVLIGSTAESVLDLLTCDVLAVKALDEPTARPRRAHKKAR